MNKIKIIDIEKEKKYFFNKVDNIIFLSFLCFAFMFLTLSFQSESFFYYLMLGNFLLIMFFMCEMLIKHIVRKKRRFNFYKFYPGKVTGTNVWDLMMNYFVVGFMKKDQHIFATTELVWFNKSTLRNSGDFKYNADKLIKDLEQLGISVKKIFVYKNSTLIVTNNENANLIKLSLKQFQANEHIHLYPLIYFESNSFLKKIKNEQSF